MQQCPYIKIIDTATISKMFLLTSSPLNLCTFAFIFQPKSLVLKRLHGKCQSAYALDVAAAAAAAAALLCYNLGVTFALAACLVLSALPPPFAAFFGAILMQVCTPLLDILLPLLTERGRS